jgi:glycopeptide antibiotics resistance protein
MQIDDVLTNTAGAMAGWLIWMNITVRQSRQSGVARATCPD